MKVEINNIQNVEMVGEVKENKVSIDTKNLEFITHILSSNLYSNPMQSFLREIISNAYDAHKEANNPDPIILDIGYDNNQLYIRVQDFGTGLGKERFNEIYRYIGSSTKRESNDYIGSFGIGRFSCLAVSDSCFITDRHDGIETKYLMYKENMTIKIDELSSTSTKEHNGLEVLVYVPITYSTQISICNSFEHISYFDKLVVNVSYPGNLGYSYNNVFYSIKCAAIQFNNRKIKKYKNFSVCPQLDDFPSLCVGSVIYPIDTAIINIPNDLRRACIQINIPIGSVNVTPNREQILYTDQTRDFIQEKVDDCYREIIDEFKARYSKIDSIDKVSDLLTPYCSCVLYDYNDEKKCINIESKKVFPDTINIFGVDIEKSELDYMYQFMRCYSFIILSRKESYCARCKNPNYPDSILSILTNRRNYSNTFIKTEERLQPAVNAWVKAKRDYIIYKEDSDNTKLTLKRTRDFYINNSNGVNFVDRIQKVTDKIVDEWKKSCKILDNNIIDEDTKAIWKPERSAKDSDRIQESYPSILKFEGSFKKSYDTLEECFKKKKVLYIWASNDNILYLEYLSHLSGILQNVYSNFSDVVFIKVAKRDIAACESVEDNFINVVDLFASDACWIKPLNKAIKVFEHSKKYVPNIGILESLCMSIPTLYEKVKSIRTNIKHYIDYTHLHAEEKEIIDNLLKNGEQYDLTEKDIITDKEDILFDFIIKVHSFYDKESLYISNAAMLLGYDIKFDYKKQITTTKLYKKYEECYKDFKVHICDS